MKMPPIHELHERQNRRTPRRGEPTDPAKPPTQEIERPKELDTPGWGPSRGNRYIPKVDETQPIPIYGD